MTRDPDDDALRWEGDDDPTLAPGWKRVGAAADGSAAPAGSTSDPGDAHVADSAATGEREEADRDTTEGTAERADASRQTGSVELVVLGVLGGVYLLYTIGWLLTAIRATPPGFSVLGAVMYELGLWFAVAAPLLGFGLVFLRVRRATLRLVWLAVGAVVLVPLAFVVGVTA